MRAFVLISIVTFLGAPAWAVDCNNNTIEDECDIDCAAMAGACNVPGCGQSTDCDSNGVPDECDLAAGATGCAFTTKLLENTTGAADSIFIGPPDDTYFGLGGQIVTYEFDCAIIVDGPGPDFTLYELDTGGPEYNAVEVFVSEDGLTFFSVDATESPKVSVPGDGAHGDPDDARSFDLGPSGLSFARYIRLDGAGAGAAGSSTGFDLDAVGVVNLLGLDCDSSGTLDECEALTDCDTDGLADACMVGAGHASDCNTNSVPDICEAGTTSLDCDADQVPDECEPDCNANTVADDCDVSAMTSEDCNSNGVPDECDAGVTVISVAFSEQAPFGNGFPLSFTIPAVVAANGDVTIGITTAGDFGSSNEFIDIDLNGTVLGRVLDSGGGQCSVQSPAIVVTAEEFNYAAGHGDAVITLITPTTVNPYECGLSTTSLTVDYAALDDCNTNTEIDYCDIEDATSNDVNSNGIPDECEPDCNSNGVPDDFDIDQGTSQDCNANEVPDECDVASATSDDCNFNVIPDECEIDCNSNTVPDDCDIAAATSQDCDTNGVPDECDLATSGAGCHFTSTLSGNTTGAADSIFTGPPDDTYFGLGGQIVTYEFDCGFVANAPGADITVYETDTGGAEFSSLEKVRVSADGLTFFDIKTTENAAVNIPGDASHGSNTFARSYDIAASGLGVVRFIELDGAGTGSAGSSTLFDLDATGAISPIGLDCDSSGTLDVCEVHTDCNANTIPDSCELATIDGVDCNSNGVPDECDVAGASLDCNTNGVPDECEPDCNTNTIPDDCDIAAATSDDCNANLVPDECDLLVTTIDADSGQLFPMGSGFPQSFTVLSAFPAAGDVTITITVYGDFGASNETLNMDLSGTVLGTLFGTGGPQCVEGGEMIVLSALEFNDIVAGGDATITVTAPSAVNPFECPNGSYVSISIGYDPVFDCNTNGTIDYCDIAATTSDDVNSNGIPDECDPDCNTNNLPDDYDIEQGTSTDCNDNLVPDECDVDSGASEDCNSDNLPDECPICPTVEVVFVMDTSTSMNDEGATLCGVITQIAADLAADLVNVDTELLAIPTYEAGTYGCLSETVEGLYGTTVPGTPPPGNETLGDCPGNPEVPEEDWGRATSVVAGTKPWLTDSVRLIVPIADEGPWCGNPVTDPGVDRESITHAITVSVANDVVVSPITGSGSSAGVIGMATDLASGTGGQVFSSSVPAEDLSDGIKDVILDACSQVNDCNANSQPDECDITEGTSQDCDMSDVPDECEADCNMNGLHDSCDIAAMTSEDVNSNSIPDECENVDLGLDEDNLQWTAVPDAIGYDVITGDLEVLHSSDGDFSVATTACLQNDLTATTLPHGGDPPVGEGVWFLTRAILGSGVLSYDTFGPGQAAPRDAGIAASGVACP